MNTMIPNKLRFNLDLQDLPTRATQVTKEALVLSGGNNCMDVKTNVRKENYYWGTCRNLCSPSFPGFPSEGQSRQCGSGYIKDGFVYCKCTPK